MLTVLDLFSGIGAFSLGLERSGGFRTVAFCECDDFCRRVLAKHWPGVPLYHDVRELTADRLQLMESGPMSYAEGFPARTSALPDRVPASAASAADCGPSSPGSLARYDRATHSLKTWQLCLDGEWETFSATLPRSGSMRSGELFPLPTWAPRTAASASGLWPTQRANENDQGPANRQAMLDAGSSWKGQGRGATLTTAVKLWPTPTADAASDRAAKYGQGGTSLALSVKLWPTPSVCGNYNRVGASPTSGDGLATAVGGALSPSWVEALMGLPPGWTDLGDRDGKTASRG